MADGNGTPGKRIWRGRETRYCEVCSAPYSVKCSRPKRACGPECGKVLTARISRERGGTPVAYCRGCSREFFATMCGGERRRYCTRACNEAKAGAVSAEISALRSIGVKARKDTRAKVKRIREAQHEQAAVLVYAIACAECGGPVQGVAFGRPRTACDSCAPVRRKAAAANWRNNTPTGRAAKHAAKAKRRMREKESVIRFDVMQVFERDGWKCRLCGIATPRELRGLMQHNAPELDHVVPIARGGAHTMENCQCLCRSCNGFKSDKLMHEVIDALVA